MERWLPVTKKQVESQKKILLVMQSTLSKRIREIRKDLRDPIGRPVRDSGDRILKFTTCTILLSESFLLSLNLRLIEGALEGMKRGEYGQCSLCGRSIRAKRMSAVPWALLCVKCQEMEEVRVLSPFAGVVRSGQTHQRKRVPLGKDEGRSSSLRLACC